MIKISCTVDQHGTVPRCKHWHRPAPKRTGAPQPCNVPVSTPGPLTEMLSSTANGRLSTTTGLKKLVPCTSLRTIPLCVNMHEEGVYSKCDQALGQLQRAVQAGAYNP